jgi:hypothetical protein
MMVAVVTAVAEAPPPRFAGGGKWGVEIQSRHQLIMGLESL